MGLFNTAYAADAANTAVAHNSGMSSILFLLVFFAIFYMLFIRPQSKRQKEHKKMLEVLSKGDEVATAGGILGTVHSLEDSFVVLQIAEDVLIKVQKSSISASLPKGTV